MASAIVPGTIFNRAVQRKEDFSDAYRASERQKFESAGQQIQQALAAPVNPYTQKQWTDDERKAAQSSLAHINSMIQNLYNPDFDPAKGAVGESILHKLTDKMKLTKAPDVAGQKAQSEQARSDVQQYTLPPGAEEAQKETAVGGARESLRQQKVANAVRAMKEAGASEDDIKQFQVKAAEAAAGVPSPKTQRFYKSPDGKQSDWFYPGEQPQGWQASSPATMVQKPPRLTFRGNQAFLTVGDHTYSQSDIATAPPELQSLFANAMNAAAAVRHTVGIHPIQVQQKDGSIKLMDVEVESTSGFGPAAPPAGKATPQTAKPPGQQKKDISAIKSKFGGGVVVGGRENTFERGLGKEAADTNAAYQSALDRQDTMHKNQQAAYRGDQQAMLSLVANHIGMTLGAQKGARINQAVWNEAIASAPWTEAVFAKWFHTDENGDHVFDGFKTGVNLTKEQVDSMVRLADEKVQTLKGHLDRAKSQLPGGGAQGQAVSDDDIINLANQAAKERKKP